MNGPDELNPPQRAPRIAEMRARVEAFDWSKTSLGPRTDWPPSLRTAVDICLDSRFPMFVWWGDELITFYNDAYAAILGRRHPAALGMPAARLWAEMWPTIKPQVQAVLTRGQASWHHRMPLPVDRNGITEEAYFTWSHSPIRREDGTIAGVLCVVVEETTAVRAEQAQERLAAQRQLALDAAGMGWWHFDPITGQSQFDHRFREIFQVSSESDLNGLPENRLHPDDLPQMRQKVKAALDPNDPKPYEAQYRIVLPDGSIRWIQAYGMASFAGEGNDRRAVSMVGTVADITDRRLAAERPGIILESITDAFYALDRDERFTYLNTAAEQLLQRRREELLGRHIWHAFPEGADSRFAQEYRRAFEQQAMVEFEAFYPPLNAWFSVRAYPSQEGLSVYFRNVTDRHRTERALRDSEQRWELAVTSSNDGIWEWNPSTQVLYWSPRCLEMLGYAEGEFAVTNLAVLDLIHPDDRPLVEQRVRDHHAGLTDRFQSEHRMRHKDGSYRWILSRGRALRGPDGRCERFMGSNSDVTERREMQERLRDSENRFSAFMNNSPTASWITDADGRVLYVSQTYAKLFGPSGGDIVGKLPQDLYSPQFAPQFLASIRQVAETGQAVEVEETAPRPDGSLGEFLVYKFPIQDRTHRVLVGGVAVDVTDRKRAEREREQFLVAERAARAEAERVSRMKDEFLATLSHELRTPLNAILGWSQILARGPRDQADLDEGLAIIERNARAQTQIIEDLLDMSRIISGKIRLDVRPVNLADIVSEALATAHPSADAKGVRLHIQLEHHLAPIHGDPSRLQQVMWNLLTNAIKFTGSGGHVYVALRRMGGQAEVSVADTGEGIALDFLPHVFDRFRQADATTTRRYGGLGLGLSIVKQLVELHGGSVRVHSDGPGKGATFNVSLPLMRASTVDEPEAALLRHDVVKAPSVPPDSVCAHMAGLKVLAIDDEADARQFLKRLLEECDAHILTAANAAEAFELIQQQRPDAIVCDIGMPGEDGYSLIQRVRKLDPATGGRTPAIAVTAYARPEDRVRALQAGFQLHLAKPIESAELLTALASVTGRTAS